MPQFDDVFADLLPAAPSAAAAPMRFSPRSLLARQGLDGLNEPGPARTPFDDTFADLVPAQSPRVTREAELDLAGTLFGAEPGQVKRTMGEAVSDAALGIRRGARNVVSGLASLPVGVANLLLEGPHMQLANRAAEAVGAEGVPNILEAFGGPAVIPQPALVRGLQESLELQNAEDTRERQSDKMRAQAAALQNQDGFLDTTGYLASNPSAAALLGAEQLPQLALGVPGSLPATLTAQVLGAAGQNEAGVAMELGERVARGEMSQAEADALAAQAFTESAGLNATLAALPGARTLERLAANRARVVPGGQTLAHVLAGTAGEGAQGALSEAGEQVIANRATGRDWSEGAGQAAALGMLLEGPAGTAGSLLEAFAGRGPAPAVAPPAGLPAATAPAPFDPGAVPLEQPTASPAPAAAPPAAQASNADPMAELDALLTQNVARAAAAAPAADLPPEPVLTAAPVDAARPSAAPVEVASDPAPQQPAAAPRARAQQARAPKATKTDRLGRPADLLQVVAARGLDRDTWLKEGIDPAEFSTRVGISYLFRKRDKKTPNVPKGMTPSDLREMMQEEGYLAQDPMNRTTDVGDSDAVDLFMRAFRGGEKLYAPDQQEAVARWREAQAEANAEYEREMRTRLTGEDFDGMMADAEAQQELAGIDRLVERAYELGATDSDIVGTAFDADSHDARGQALRTLIEDLEREADQRAVAGGPDGVDGQAQEGAFDDDGDFPGWDAPSWRVEQPGAPYGQPGLFGNATSRDEVDAARRRRDDQRNGRTGTGRTDMLAGDGELFAGARPQQADVEGGADSTGDGRPWRVEQPAYHGTPHTVDRFSLQKIGTGEGNQTFGWGMYFASRREVAEHYRGGVGGANERTDELRPAALAAIKRNGLLGFDTAGEALGAVRRHSDFAERWELDTEEDAAALRAYRESFGNLYQVEVPEDSDLLDWDQHLTDQPARVRQALEVEQERYRSSDGVEGAYVSGRGDQIYRQFVRTYGSPEAASRRLGELGIPGLRYLDGASRSEGIGSRNYVIWDEAQVSDPLRVGEPRAKVASASRDMFVPTRGDRNATDATLRNPSTDPGSDRAASDPRPAAPAAGRGDGGREPAPDSRGTAGDLQRRPDYTPELGRRAQFAVDELVRRFGGTLLGDSIARSFRDVGTAQLIGRRVQSDEDLAAIAEVYRNPIYETLRYVFVDDAGNVLGESAVTSRMPAAAQAFPVEDDGPQWVKDTASRFGATGVWLVHNHPSGNPDPSRADISMTARLNAALNEKGGVSLRGHVVLNHTVFSYIAPDGAVRSRKPIKRAELRDPLREQRGILAGRFIDGPPRAAAAAAEAYNGDARDKVAVMVLDNQRMVRLAATLPVDALRSRRGGALLSTLARRSGGMSIILVADAGVVATDWRAFKRAGELGLALDVLEVAQSGQIRSLALEGFAAGVPFNGRYVDSRPSGRMAALADSEAGLQVYESGPSGRQTATPQFRRWFGDSVVTRDGSAGGEPLPVYHGTAEEFDVFQDLAGSATGHATAALGHFFTPDRRLAEGYAENASGGVPADERVVDAYLAIERPYRMGLEEAQEVDSPEAARAFRRFLERQGHDGIHIEGADVWVAFRPQQIKSASQNNGDFDRENPSMVREDPVPYTDGQREFMRKAGLQDAVQPPTTMERLRRWAREAGPDLHPDNLIQSTFDRFHAIKRATEAKGDIAPENDPYLAARLVNTSSTMEAILRFGAPKLEDGVLKVNRDVPGLLEALGPVAQRMPQFLGWMVARRAEALKRMGREHLMTDADIRAGLSLAEGHEQEFAAAATGYLKLKNAILDLAEQAGTVDPAARAAWDHAEYVPFYRQMSPEGEEATAAPGTKEGVKRISAGIKELKGGKSALEDPLGNIIKNFVRLVDSAMKNRAMTLAVDQIGAPYFVPAQMKMKQELIPLDQVRRHLNDAGVDPAIVDGMPAEALEGVRKMLAIKAPEGPDILRVMRDGKAEYYHVMDPLLLRSMDAFAEAPTHWFVKMLGLAKNVLTAGATSTPDFIIRNWIRDTGEAAITAQDKFVPVLDSVRGAVESLRESELAQDLMMAGGYFHSGLFRQGDVADTAKAIRRALRSTGMSQTAVNRYMRSIVNPVKWWDQYRRLSESTEMGSRIALARRRMEAGAGDVRAVFEAKDFLDFQMHGDAAFVQFFLKTVPFLNARLQGMYRLGRVTTGKNRRGKVAAKLAMLATASMALAWWNTLMYGDAYDELEEWDRDANWHIAPGTEFHMRIPKPFELGLVGGTLPERMLASMRYALTNGEAGDRPEQSWDAFWHAITSTLAINPLPQAIKPGVEAYTNYNMFFGTPIESKGDQYRPTSERFSPTSTSKVSRYLSKGVEKLLGDENTISPKKLDHLWRGYTGGMGMYLLGAADWFIDRAEGAPVRPARALRDFPVLGTVARGDNEPRSTRYVSDLYDLDSKADFRSAAVKTALEDGDEARAKRLEAEWGWLLGERVKSRQAKGGFMHKGVRELNQVSRAMAATRKDDQRIYQDRKLTAEEKREALDRNAAQRNALAKRLVRQIREREREWQRK